MMITLQFRWHEYVSVILILKYITCLSVDICIYQSKSTQYHKVKQLNNNTVFWQHCLSTTGYFEISQTKVVLYSQPLVQSHFTFEWLCNPVDEGFRFVGLSGFVTGDLQVVNSSLCISDHLLQLNDVATMSQSNTLARGHSPVPLLFNLVQNEDLVTAHWAQSRSI